MQQRHHQAADRVRKLLQRAWGERPDELSWSIAELQRWLATDRRDLEALPPWMIAASGWCSSQGVRRLLDGDETGWADVLAGNRWRLAADRLAAELVARGRVAHAAINPNHFALRVALATSFGDPGADAAWGLATLRRGLPAASTLYLGTDRRWVAHAIAGVLARDYGERQRTGIYAPLLEALRDGRAAPVDAVLAACAYRVDRAGDTRGPTEFGVGPFAVVPAELELFRRAGALGDAPSLADVHPVFALCPFRVPSIVPPDDVLLARVRKRAGLD